MTSVDGISVQVTTESEAWAVGLAVLALGENEDGVRSLAVWHVSPAGQPTGAWIEPYPVAGHDEVTARRLLPLIERRALVDGSAPLSEVVDEIGSVAAIDVDSGWWTGHVVSTAGFLDDVVERRELIEQVVMDAREAGRAVAPVSWNRDIREIGPSPTAARLRDVAGLVRPPGAPVVSEALAVVRSIEWLVGVWRETEQVKNRRVYVAEALGESEPLPPTWRSALLAANTSQLPL